MIDFLCLYSYQFSEKPAVEDRSAEIEQLKKDLEAANARIATLQQENESLTNQVNAKKEESSSSSSDNNNQAEEISSLKAQLEDRNNTCSEQERTIESLRVCFHGSTTFYFGHAFTFSRMKFLI